MGNVEEKIEYSTHSQLPTNSFIWPQGGVHFTINPNVKKVRPDALNPIYNAINDLN